MCENTQLSSEIAAKRQHFRFHMDNMYGRYTVQKLAAFYMVFNRNLHSNPPLFLVWVASRNVVYISVSWGYILISCGYIVVCVDLMAHHLGCMPESAWRISSLFQLFLILNPPVRHLGFGPCSGHFHSDMLMPGEKHFSICSQALTGLHTIVESINDVP